MSPVDEDVFVECGKAGRPIEGCTVVDAHAHLGECYQFSVFGEGIDSVIGVMDRLGVDAIAVSSMEGCMGGVHRGNDEIIEAVRKYSDRVVGYITVNPAYPDEAGPELVRCLAAGLTALKVHSSFGVPYEDERYNAIFDFATEHGLPILAHTWASELDALEKRMTQHDGVNWILGHAGSAEPERYARVGKTYPNAYLETCLSTSPRGLVEYFVEQGLRDKVLWGSDTTFLGMPAQFGRVLFAKIAPEDKRAILGGNACRVLPVPTGAHGET